MNSGCRDLRARVILFGLATAVTFSSADAAQFRVLHSFTGGNDGARPEFALLADSSGNLYGTTSQGGGTGCTVGCGVIYKIAPDGTETILHAFTGGSDGADPNGPLVSDASGNLYGTTGAYADGYSGTVFKVSPGGVLTTLHSFTKEPDGVQPLGGVILDGSGNLYGTTYYGGTEGYGTVYRIAPDGIETILHSFDPQKGEGGEPFKSLLRDPKGNFYGIAGAPGEIYKVDKKGALTVLYTFRQGDENGSFPAAALIRDKLGNLYGTTTEDGSYDYGTAYKLAPDGTMSVLYSFDGGKCGGDPVAGLLADKQGNFYGETTTTGDEVTGAIFRLGADGTMKRLHRFTGREDGGDPTGGLISGPQGLLYGVASLGGSKDEGTVFAVSK